MAFSNSGFIGLGFPGFPQGPTKASQGFSMPCRFSLDLWGRTSPFFGDCGSVMVLPPSASFSSEELLVLATNMWALWLHSVSFSFTFPHCIVSTSKDVLSLLPSPFQRLGGCGVLCALLITSLRYQVTTPGPPLALLGAPSSQCLLSPGPGLFHFLSVDNPVCVLCVTVGWGERPALHHAARR